MEVIRENIIRVQAAPVDTIGQRLVSVIRGYYRKRHI